MVLQLTDEEIEELNSYTGRYCHLKNQVNISRDKLFIDKFKYKSTEENFRFTPLKNFFENFSKNILSNSLFSFRENHTSIYFTIPDINSFNNNIQPFILETDAILVDDGLNLSICSTTYYLDTDRKIYSKIGGLIHSVKREGQVDKIEELQIEIKNLINCFNFNIYGNDFIIIAVPSSFEISQNTAKLISQKTGNQCFTAEIVNQSTSSQKSKHSRIDRLKNVNGKIEINLPQDVINGKSILLVDDNYQSGATLNYIGKILKKYYNVREVYAFCLTKTSSNLK